MKALPKVHSSPAAPIRILLVDDSEDIRFILKMELEVLGYSVELAKDGIEGLKRARSFRPDVIVSDIGMPGLDGVELLKHLRENEELADVPVIALTGYGSERELIREHGFHAQMVKPVDGHSLANVVQTLICDNSSK